MHVQNKKEMKFLLIVILSIFLIPTSTGALVEIYVNDTDVLNSEDDITFQGGNNLKLIIRLSGDFKYDSENENLSVRSMSISVDFLSDTDNRGSTSGIPGLVAEGNDANVEYEEYEAIFRSTDPIFKDYNGKIQFSVLMKNASKGIVRDEQFEITIQSSSNGGDDSGGFSMPSLNLPEPIQENLMYILGALIGLIILSVGLYTFVLAPEDTTADLYKAKKSIDPLSKSLTGVGYDSELPSESKLKRLEDSKANDGEEEDDDEYTDLDDGEDDDDFDESELLASLTGGSQLKSDEEEKTPPKKKVKRKVVKKAVTKKVVRKSAPKTATTPKEPDVNMGQGIKDITCPSCETVHHIDESTTKFICSCGRRIRV